MHIHTHHGLALSSMAASSCCTAWGLGGNCHGRNYCQFCRRSPNAGNIRSKCGHTYFLFLVQGIGLCLVYNEILRLGFLSAVVWFLIVYMHRASIVHVVHIELQAGL
jgi:hypothetical protein